jgi:CDP-glycerol glycerophosphotransferase (TagB/SpsB family)
MFAFLSHPDFACNPHALWEYIVKNTRHDTAWLVRKDGYIEALRKRGIRCELYDTERGNALIAEADFLVINSTIFDTLPPKNSRQIYVNLWHGSGIKAHDFASSGISDTQARKVLYYSRNTDLMCVHSLDDRYRLSAILRYDPRKVVVTGQPRLDCVTASDGRSRLREVLGNSSLKYEHLILFAPSARANTYKISGEFYSDNIFRLVDFDDQLLYRFLEEHNAAIFYKLHPTERITLSNVRFELNSRCIELTDDMLFSADVQYTEILNAFDVLITDYSSIAFDWLLLDRPTVYLVPDYTKYSIEQGFTMRNPEFYMPGAKVQKFAELLVALNETFTDPMRYHEARMNVIYHRFDYIDDQSARRCYETILNYIPPKDISQEKEPLQMPLLPSNAELLRKYLPDCFIIDATKEIASRAVIENLCCSGGRILYITEEKPDEKRSVSKRSLTDIADLNFYRYISSRQNVRIEQVSGGVEYDHFQNRGKSYISQKTVIGFAGCIDCRLWLAAMQYLSAALPECEIVFAGDTPDGIPPWFGTCSNLRFLGGITYDELPCVVNSFDVAVLPMYGKYKERVPSELFWFLAAGKPVVTSDMPNLPECGAIFKAASVVEFVLQTKKAIKNRSLALSGMAKEMARAHDWTGVAKKILKGRV